MTALSKVLTWKYGSEKGYNWSIPDTETYESIEWRCELPKPSEDQLQMDVIDYENYQSSISYISKRKNDYPDICTQFDMQYNDLMNGTTTWKDAITNVKQKYPKPE